MLAHTITRSVAVEDEHAEFAAFDVPDVAVGADEIDVKSVKVISRQWGQRSPSPSLESDGLVPHLSAAFKLNTQSQVNLDPIVLAVACYLKHRRASQGSGISVNEVLHEGQTWFPQRSVTTFAGEQGRLARFAKTYPDIFSYESYTNTIHLKPHSLFIGDPDVCDENWYIIALYRLVESERAVVNEVLDEIEV